MMRTHFDLIIVGAGLVGTSIVSALISQGWRIAVLEKNLTLSTTGLEDTRPLSLSYGSSLILRAIGVWDVLKSHACPIQSVHVSNEGALGAVHFQGRDFSVPALGYVVPFSKFRQLLYSRAAASSAVTFMPCDTIHTVLHTESISTIQFENANGKCEITAPLLIACDGARSKVRELIGVETKNINNNEIAWTMTCELQQSHRHNAFQRFTDDGILALLPLPNEKQVRLVWTMPETSFETFLKMDLQMLKQTITNHFQTKVPMITKIDLGQSFPLEMIIAKEQVYPGLVLMGNAAHTLYPLAAQGFNLALRDVAVLCEILVNAEKCHQSIGQKQVLAEYITWRLKDQKNTIQMTKGISKLFEFNFPFAKRGRGIGLLLTDIVFPLKKRIGKQLMGIAGQLPKLSRGIPL